MNSADKQAVLHCLKTMIDEEVCEECPLYGTTGTDHCEKDCVRLAINELEKEPKMGHWERDQFTNQPTCSVCGYKVFGGQTRYCPDCGAKMLEVE